MFGARLPEAAAEFVAERLEVLVAVQADDDALQLRATLEVAVHLRQQDAGAAVDRVAKDAGGNRRDRDRALAVAIGEGQRRAHRGGQLAVLVALAHAWANGMDHLLRLQRAGARHHRRADRRAADSIALVLDRGTALLANGARDAAAKLQILVGRVDNRVDCKLSDVSLDQLEQSIVHPDGHNLLPLLPAKGRTYPPFSDPRATVFRTVFRNCSKRLDSSALEKIPRQRRPRATRLTRSEQVAVALRVEGLAHQRHSVAADEGGQAGHQALRFGAADQAESVQFP